MLTFTRKNSAKVNKYKIRENMCLFDIQNNKEKLSLER
ncbi:hypothetical protein EZS27_023965 [termite gut metagenome]|uniref:Uncharacterized protein n=1 Tax=termite gut metagenome TaxID=433724 RepID=A0A5J4R1X9_9ZZZZ